MTYLVLETSGKRESVDFAKVLTFDSLTEANRYVNKTCTGPIKYWTKAEIVQSGEKVELYMPEGNWE